MSGALLYLSELARDIGNTIILWGYDFWGFGRNVKDFPVLGVALNAGLRGLGDTMITLGAKIQATSIMLIFYAGQAQAGELQNAPLIGLTSLIGEITAFFSSPVTYILTRLFLNYPMLVNLFQRPTQWVKDMLGLLNKELTKFINDPRTYINNLVKSGTAYLDQIKGNPVNWILGALGGSFPFVREFLHDPVGWVNRTLGGAITTIQEIMRDPVGYIIEKCVLGLERFTARYSDRLVKVAETIINLIF